MSDEETENGSTLNKGIPTPAKILVGLAVIILLALLVTRFGGCDRKPETPDGEETAVEGEGPAPVELPEAFPEHVLTQWPDVSIRIDSVSRHDQNFIIAHWTYRNEAAASPKPFRWGEDQPNVVALTQLKDATGRDYSVALSGTGVPMCSSIRDGDESLVIPGGGTLPAWALFAVPNDASLPLSIVLYGNTQADAAGIPVPVLTADEQAKRALIPRETSWPDVWIQLDEVARTAPGTYRVRWRYLNRNLEKGFSWSREQVDLPKRTQLFDFATGSYRDPTSASSIHSGADGGPTTIPPGGELPAETIFKNVNGDHFELIFHGALPVFYDDSNTN